EKGHARVDVAQKVEDPAHLPLERGPWLVPTGDPVAASDQLVPVLEVDAQEHRRPGARGMRLHVAGMLSGCCRRPGCADPRLAALLGAVERLVRPLEERRRVVAGHELGYARGER